MVGGLEPLHIEGQVGLGPNEPWASLSSGFKDSQSSIVYEGSMYFEREIFVMFWSN